MSQQPRVAFAWDGLPYYAARQLKRVVQEQSIAIIATPGLQTKEEIVRTVGQEVIWLEGNENASWQNLGLPVPDWFFVSGWSTPQFNLLTRQVREAGGCVIVMTDNRRMHNIRQTLGSIAFRVMWRRLFDYAFVPGVSGRDLMRFFGVPEERIRSGLYGADTEVFTAGPPISTRERDFLFVGRFVEPKGLLDLVKSVADLRRAGASFTLAALGAGKLEGALLAAGVTVLPFGDACYVAREMRKSRFLVLPSRNDNWGVVVHEAACSGCGLILSDGVGAAPDLLTVDNGLLYRQGDSKLLTNVLATALQMSTGQLTRCRNASLHLATRFGPDRFSAVVNDILSIRVSGTTKQANMTT